MAANDFAAQNGTEKLSTNALNTVNGTTVTADLIEVQRMKMGFGSDGALRDVDAANGLPVLQVGNSLVSTANSSVVNLAAAAVFTGVAEDVSEYSTIMVSIFSSHAGATDGLQLQQSSDGTNWDFGDVYTIPATTGKAFSIGVQAKFFRIVYTNGATLTTSLRIQAIYSKAAKKFSSVRPQDGRTNDNDFEEVLSYPMGWNGVTWDRLKSKNGRLGVDTDSARNVTFKGAVGSFRILGAAALLHNLFSIENAAGSTVLVKVTGLDVKMDATAVLVAVVPFIKLSRPTASPTGGTVLNKANRDTALASNASVVVRGANASDGGAATAITATQGAMFKAAGGFRLHTAVGQVLVDGSSLLPLGEPIILRAGEALLAVVDAAVATSNPATNHWQVGVAWEEYTEA